MTTPPRPPRRTRSPIRRAVDALRRLAAQLSRQSLQLWRTHRSFLLTNTAYAAALAASAGAVVTQTTLADLIAALIDGALAVRHALTRHTQHNHHPFGIDPFEGDLT